MADQNKSTPYVAPTDQQIARMQDAVAKAYEDWSDEMEKNPAPASMTPTGPSEYPQFAHLIDADQDAHARLTKAVNDGLAGAAGHGDGS